MQLKSQRICQFFIVLSTFSLLVLPTVVWFSICNKFDPSYFSDVKLGDMLPKIDRYYDQNSPFRKQLISAYHGFTSKVGFRATNHIPGIRSNWLFLKRTYPGFSGKKRFADYEKKKIIHKLEAIDSFLKKRNIKFIIMITPDKIQIYPELLPWVMRRKQAEINACEDLVQFIHRRSHISICYPKKSLLENKKSGLLYYPNDSHWNMKGAYIAFAEIAKIIDHKISFPQPEEWHWIQKEITFGDLGLVFPYEMPFPAGIRHTTTYDAQHTFDPDRKDRRFVSPKAPSKLKILVFHDSFFASMEPYFHYFFHETHQLAASIDFELVEKEKPQIVFYQIVERNISSFLDLPSPVRP